MGAGTWKIELALVLIGVNFAAGPEGSWALVHNLENDEEVRTNAVDESAFKCN